MACLDGNFCTVNSLATWLSSCNKCVINGSSRATVQERWEEVPVLTSWWEQLRTAEIDDDNFLQLPVADLLNLQACMGQVLI